MIKIKNRGFLSIEALFITAMVAMLTSVCGMYVIGGRMVARSANLTTAVFLAEKQMVCVKGLLATGVDLSGMIGWLDKEDKMPLIKNGTEFTVATTIENSGGHRLKHILIHVSWREHGAAEQDIQLESLCLNNE